MWRAGFVDEVRLLEGRGLREGRTASRALGYAQLLSSFDGACTEDEARLETVTATRRFARRQDSWLRRDPRIVWGGGAAAERIDQVADWVSRQVDTDADVAVTRIDPLPVGGGRRVSP